MNWKGKKTRFSKLQGSQSCEGGNFWSRQIEGQVYASDKGRDLDPGNLKDTKLGSPSWESGPESGPHA
jgi:hypothetical protein